MPNPWENDEIISETPWESDEIVSVQMPWENDEVISDPVAIQPVLPTTPQTPAEQFLPQIEPSPVSSLGIEQPEPQAELPRIMTPETTQQVGEEMFMGEMPAELADIQATKNPYERAKILSKVQGYDRQVILDALPKNEQINVKEKMGELATASPFLGGLVKAGAAGIEAAGKVLYPGSNPYKTKSWQATFGLDEKGLEEFAKQYMDEAGNVDFKKIEDKPSSALGIRKKAFLQAVEDFQIEPIIQKGVTEKAKEIMDVGEVLDPFDYKKHRIEERIEKLKETDSESAAAWTKGDLGFVISQAIADAAIADNPEQAKKAIELRGKFEKAVMAKPEEKKGMLKGLYLSTLEMLAPMVKTGVKMAVPVVGKAWGGYEWARQGMGDVYADMIEAGVSHETARKISPITGVAYAGIEQLQFGQLTNVAGKLGKDLVNKSVKKALLGILKEKGEDFFKEVGEEGMQRVITDIGAEIGKQVDGVSEKELSEILLDAGMGAVEEMGAAAGPMGVLTLLGIGGATIKQTAERRAKGKPEISEEELAAFEEQRIEGKKEKMLEDVGVITEKAQEEKRFPVTTKIKAVKKEEAKVEKIEKKGIEVGKVEKPPKPTEEELAELSKPDVEEALPPLEKEVKVAKPEKPKPEVKKKVVTEEKKDRVRKEEKVEEKKLPTPEEIEKKPEAPKPKLAKELIKPIPFKESLTEVEKQVPKELWNKVKFNITETPGKTQGSIQSDGKYLNITLDPKMPIERAVPVIFHEVMGHAGASNVLRSNDKIFKRMNALYNAPTSKPIKALIKNNYKTEFEGMSKEESKEALFSEWIAHSVEEHMTNPEKRGTAYKVWRAVRQFLVDMGFAEDTVEDAMESIVREIRKTTKFEAKVEVEPKFAKEIEKAKPQTKTPAFKKWFGDSKVAVSEGVPQVVYHGTPYEFTEFEGYTSADHFGFHFGTGPAAYEAAQKKGGLSIDVEVEDNKDGTWSVWKENEWISDHKTKDEAQKEANKIPKERPLMATYLNIENPIEMPDLGVWKWMNVARYLWDNKYITKRDYEKAFNSSNQERAVADIMLKKGYDGIKYTNTEEDPGSVSWIALNPTQIKSATGNLGTFDPTKADIRYAKELREEAKPFYSPTERKISELKQEKGVVPQIQSMVKKGQLKKAEVEWMGLEEFLSENPKATKAEVQEFVRANEVTVEESELGGKDLSDDQLKKLLSEYYGTIDIQGDKVYVNQEMNAKDEDTGWETISYEEAQRRANEQRHQIDEDPTKYSQYTLPGGTSYRELLFRMPMEVPKFGEYAKKRGYTWEQVEGFFNKKYKDEKLQQIYDEWSPARNKALAEKFKTSHFEEPNIFAHARVNDRVTPEGEKVLFIEEIQSDWAREARERGVKKDEKGAERAFSNYVKRLEVKYEQPLVNIETENLYSEFEKESLYDFQRKMLAEEKGVPDFPFKKNYHEFVLKNLLKRAVQEGYDRISWISGEQTADRYDLSKQVDEVFYEKNTGGGYNLIVRKDGMNVITETNIAENKVADYIGKEPAKRLLESEEITDRMGTYKVIKGVDLKIGGEWAKNLYDKMIPKFLAKYSKKWDAKVEETDLGGEFAWDVVAKDGSVIGQYSDKQKAQQEANKFSGAIIRSGKTKDDVSGIAKQQSLPITPQMKESVTYEGQPMFSKELESRDIDGIPVDAFVDEEKKAAIAYEAAKDVWIGEKDIRIHHSEVDQRLMQKRVKKALGIKKYGEKAKLYDQAMQIYIDIKRSPGDIEKYKDKLTPYQKKIVEMSQNLPEGLQTIADEIEENYQELGLEAQEADVIKNVLDNYAGRIWDLEEKKGRPTTEAMRKFGTKTGHAKQRVFATIIEGWAAGYDLKVKGATNNLKILKDSIVKTIEDKRFLKTLQGIKTIDGDPLVTTQQKEGYVRIEHSNFKVWKHAGTAEEGKSYGKNFFLDENGNLFERRELYAPKEQAKNLNNILGVSRLMDVMGFKQATKYNAIFKAWILQSSLFHHMAYMRSYELGTLGKRFGELNPIDAYHQGIKAMEQKSPIIAQLVRNGLTLGLKQDWNEDLLREKTIIGKVLDKTKATKAVKDKILQLREAQAEFLFGEFGAGLKAKAAMIEYRNLIKKHPNMNTDTAAKYAANLINDDFGGLHLQRIGRNPTLQHMFRLFALAPDWTESNIRSMVKMVGAGTKEERAMYRKFWAGIATKGVLLTVAANALFSIGAEDDDEKFFNKLKRAWGTGNDWKKLRWLDADITNLYKALGGKSRDRKYFSILGHFKDPLKFATSTIRSMHHKGSVLYKTFHEAFVGVDWAGRRFTTFPELLGVGSDLGMEEAQELRGKTVTWKRGEKGGVGPARLPSYLLSQARGLQPVQIQNLIAWSIGEMETFDAIANSLGLGVRTTYGGEQGRFYKNKKQITKLRDKYKFYKEKGEREKALKIEEKISPELESEMKSVEKDFKKMKSNRQKTERNLLVARGRKDKAEIKRLKAEIERYNKDISDKLKKFNQTFEQGFGK